MRHMVWSILLLTLLCGICSAATLSVDPAESIRSKGETVTLTIKVQDVSSLGGFDIDVNWKPSVATLDTEPGNVTIGPLFSGHVNHSAVYHPQSGRIRVAALNATLAGISGDADLFTVRLKANDDTGASTPVNLTINNYGFLNSTSGGNITVSAVNNATIKTNVSSKVEARVAVSSSQAIAGQEGRITASVVNQRGVTTSPLDINISIINGTGNLVNSWDYSAETILAWGKFQRELVWTPGAEEVYTIRINVTSAESLSGATTHSTTVTAKEYTLEFNSEIYGPWDGRASTGSWFYMYAYVNASQSGNVWFNITTPDHVNVPGAKNQTRYLYAYDWNYVDAWLWSDTPGKISAGDIQFDVAANGKADSRGGPEVLIWIPSIRVSSANVTSVNSGQDGELTFNTLHTNRTYDNVTKIVVQSGARGRTLSGLEYLVGYPYGCVEQTTSRMLASLNVKNYYLGRDDRPADWNYIRDTVNISVAGGVAKLLVGGEVGQNTGRYYENSAGGWSLWGGEPSESSSSSYAGYTLARINMPGEDLNRLLAGKITNGSGFEAGKVNFESLVKWFHDNPDNRASGTWTWSAHVCHSWTPESNTAFVMLIHDMINQTVELDEEHLGYMEDNMRNATRYFVETQNTNDGSWSSGDDQAMATALAIWGLEVFGMPSGDVSEAQIADAKAAALAWLIDAQESDGSWPVDSYYGWYDGGRRTEATAYAVLALNATGLTADNKTISGGVNWLIDQYESGGSWGYTWASQVAIDALIQCQPSEVTTGTVKVFINEELIGAFSVDATNPRESYPLTKDQMDALMTGGTPIRPIKASGGNGEVRSHVLTATLTDGSGPILVSVDHSQSAPVNEIDGKIRDSQLIQSFGYEEDAGLLQISTDIGILSDAPLVQENTNTYTVDVTSTQMVAGEKAAVTIEVKPEKTGVYAPMIEIPVAGFIFDNETGIIENDGPGAFEYLNGTTGNDHPSLFIQSVAWNVDELQTYQFNITPGKHGALDLDLRIRPLYDETDVYLFNETFTVKGRGNVSVNVVDEDGAPVEAESIAFDTTAIENRSSYAFTGILEGTYTLVVNGTGGHPSIRTAARVTPDATALCNVTLPSSLLSPTMVFSEGGAGSIASVAQVEPEQLNALRNEDTTYTVTVLGDGGEIGIALEFPMRYLMTEPVVKVNGDPTRDYEVIDGTFKYGKDGASYSTTNATLMIYNPTAGSNTIEIGFKGGLLGDATANNKVDIYDAVAILDFVVGNIEVDEFQKAYEYSDATRNDKTDLYDAVAILNFIMGSVNEYYDPVP